MRFLTTIALVFAVSSMLGCTKAGPSAEQVAAQAGTGQQAQPSQSPRATQTQPIALPSNSTPDHVVTVFLNAMRSGDSPTTGYGLLVHGQMENSQFRDYGFLIYNGDSPKYSIVQHKSSNETKLVSWTASDAIRTGTTPNQLEVRIRDRRLDFYINGQFITSITDSEGFSSGRVGFYSSDSQEVAFDDLEISR